MLLKVKYDALAEAYDTAYNAWAKYKSLGVVSQFTTAAPTTPIPARPTAPYRPDAYSGMYLPKEDGKEAGKRRRKAQVKQQAGKTKANKETG